MQLNVGDQVLIQCGTFGDRLLSVVVDIVPDKSLSIFLKLPPRLLKHIEEVQTITVQFVHESTLMGFTTVVTTYCSNPACVLQLAYPDNVEIQDIRKEKRLECNFPGTLGANGQPYRCMVKNISRSGVCVQILKNSQPNIRAIFDESMDMTLEFFVIEERNRYAFSCTILREYIQDSKRYAVLLIPRKEQATRNILDAYIQSVFGALHSPENSIL